MKLIATDFINFFIENFPDIKTIIIGTPISLLWSFLLLYTTGYFKKRYNLKTGYTRKIFHFSIFTSVAVIQIIWDTSTVCLYGGVSSIIILYSIIKGEGNILYEAIAREKDAPNRTYYIVIPYLATVLGGILSNVLFNEFAVFGYLVAGMGDAIGEPVGTMYGKHKYRVIGLRKYKGYRTVEGSFAVLIVSFLVLCISSYFIKNGNMYDMFIAKILLISIIVTIVEAISPHGWDNLTMQLSPAYFMFIFW